MTATTSKLGADMLTDEQIAHFGHTYSEEHDEPLFTFDRAGFIACVRALLARQPAAVDKEASIPEEVRHALTHAIGGWRGAACGTRDDEEGDRRSADYRRRAQVIENWLAASTSANVAQAGYKLVPTEPTAAMVDALWDGLPKGFTFSNCTPTGVIASIIAAAPDQSANVAQGAEAVVLQHVAVAEDGGKLRWMSGRRPRDCELYAMHDGGRIPPKLYAAPPAQTALTDDARDAAFERYADALLAISRYAKYTPGTAVEMCRIAHKALYKNAAQSASGDTK